MARSIIKYPASGCNTTPQEVSIHYGGGKDGLSAFDYAVAGGYGGTEQEFYTDLANLGQSSPETLPAQGPTQDRPQSPPTGFIYFDTDLSQPIWWSGDAWVDSQGVDVDEETPGLMEAPTIVVNDSDNTIYAYSEEGVIEIYNSDDNME